MADYWKSQPRKFCDFCKCWIADNRPSIEFHEKGKKHQDNVKLRLTQIGHKGQKMWKEKQNYDAAIDAMERDAMAAFKKDLERNPELASHYKERAASMPSTSKKDSPEEKPDGPPPLPGPNYGYGKPDKSKKRSNMNSKNKKKTEPKPTNVKEPKDQRQWYEAKSEDGYSYYWHISSGESVWDPPGDGFVSVEEQEKMTKEQENVANEQVQERNKSESENSENSSESNGPVVESKSNQKEKSPNQESVMAAPVPEITGYGPAPRPNPLGEWIPVVKPKFEPIELDLPEKRPSAKQPFLDLLEEEPFSFGEKTVTDVGFEQKGSVSFKRRNIQGSKRNVRKRMDD